MILSTCGLHGIGIDGRREQVIVTNTVGGLPNLTSIGGRETENEKDSIWCRYYFRSSTFPLVLHAEKDSAS